MTDEVKPKYKLKFSHGYMFIGSLIVIMLWLFTDPDNNIIRNLPFGASTIATIVLLLKTILYVTMLHFSRHALTDYIDLELVFNKAMETADGAGKVFIGISILSLALSILIYASVHF